MPTALLIASNHAGDHLSRAGDHAVVIGVAVVIALIVAMVYGLVRLVARSRTRSGRARGPEA